MKVCIFGPSNLRYMPYLRYYREVLDTCGRADVTVFYWDRFSLDEDAPGTHGFHRPDNGGINRLLGYAAYRRFLRRALQAADYDVYVVLTAQLAVLLHDVLSKTGVRFILDIRDYSHENMAVFRWLLGDLVRKAEMVCISSPRFEKWLPKGREYVISHNMSAKAIQAAVSRASFDQGEQCAKVISYIGSVNYYEANVRFLRAAGSLSDVVIRYIGDGPCIEKLREYCSKKGFQNVRFFGGFQPEEKPGFYQSTHFVLACYGNDNPVVASALPNRLYESCIFRRPIIVTSGTYLAEVVAEYGLGIVMDSEDPGEFAAQLDRYLDPGHFARYEANCEMFLARVSEEIGIFQGRVRMALANGFRQEQVRFGGDF